MYTSIIFYQYRDPASILNQLYAKEFRAILETLYSMHTYTKCQTKQMMVCLRSLKDFGSVDCKVTCIEEKLFMIEEEIQSQNNQCQCGQSSVSERYLNFSYWVFSR